MEQQITFTSAIKMLHQVGDNTSAGTAALKNGFAYIWTIIAP
jgi:hypothetical protein